MYSDPWVQTTFSDLFCKIHVRVHVQSKLVRSSPFVNVGADPSNAHLEGHSLDGKPAPAFSPAMAFSSADPSVVRKSSSNKSSAKIKSDKITVCEGVWTSMPARILLLSYTQCIYSPLVLATSILLIHLFRIPKARY